MFELTQAEDGDFQLAYDGTLFSKGEHVQKFKTTDLALQLIDQYNAYELDSLKANKDASGNDALIAFKATSYLSFKRSLNKA